LMSTVMRLSQEKRWLLLLTTSTSHKFLLPHLLVMTEFLKWSIRFSQNMTSIDLDILKRENALDYLMTSLCKRVNLKLPWLNSIIGSQNTISMETESSQEVKSLDLWRNSWKTKMFSHTSRLSLQLTKFGTNMISIEVATSTEERPLLSSMTF
jgi:hypothetical protein